MLAALLEKAPRSERLRVELLKEAVVPGEELELVVAGSVGAASPCGGALPVMTGIA